MYVPFSDAAQKSESRARAAYLSAVRRALSQKTILIADGGPGLNIKGSRYELWCATRELGLRCATVRPPRLIQSSTWPVL